MRQSARYRDGALSKRSSIDFKCALMSPAFSPIICERARACCTVWL
jgi:hypothetical protein